jgi:hypothetical protein
MRWQKKLVNAPYQFEHKERGHGRQTIRKIALCSIDVTASGMPYGITLIKVRCKQSAQSDWDTRYYLSSLPPDSRTAEKWLTRIRGHWKCESQHWRKDGTLREDQTRTRNTEIMSNLIVLRNLVLHYYHHYGEAHAKWLSIWVEQNQVDIRNVFTLVTRNTASNAGK